jgi:hypothetical protein
MTAPKNTLKERVSTAPIFTTPVFSNPLVEPAKIDSP